MNNQEAKFILGAYRADGRDAGDPMFAEALAQAERDPELRSWLERQQKFDTAVTGKLREIAPPAELRQAILAGVRASQPRRHWWANPSWLAAAAAIVVIGAVTIKVVPSTGRPPVWELSAFAMSDLENAHGEHVGHPLALTEEQNRLANASLPLKELDLNLDELKRKNCRSVRVAGREVFEICFKQGGTWYHLYAAHRKDFAPGTASSKSLIASRGGLRDRDVGGFEERLRSGDARRRERAAAVVLASSEGSRAAVQRQRQRRFRSADGIEPPGPAASAKRCAPMW